MGDLIRPDGQLVNGSASQRQIAFLESRALDLASQVEHLRAMLAVLTVQGGGSVSIPIEDLKASYTLEAVPSADEKAIVWTAAKQVAPLIAVPPPTI